MTDAHRKTVLNNQERCRAQDRQLKPANNIALRFFELARVLVRFDHVASLIVKREPFAP
jgi:hypothetical protein